MDIEWSDAGQALSVLGRQVGLWRWELRGNRLEWSDGLLRMLGYSRYDFTGDYTFFTERLHPDDAPLEAALLEGHLVRGEPYEFQYRMRHRDGQYRTLVAQGAAVVHGAGKATEMIGTAIDVSGEMRASAALRASKDLFRSMAENVPGALIRYLRHANGSDEIEYLSPGCEALWEISADEVGKDPTLIWNLVVEEDLQAVRDSVALSAQTLTPWNHRWRIRTPSGVFKYLESHSSVARSHNGTVVWNTVIQDVTREAMQRDELLKHQQMLNHAQRLESIGRIAAGVAHDFNNLLAIIMGNAELYERAPDATGRRLSTREIVDACKHGSQLTGALLSFARQSELHAVVLDINDVVRRSHELVGRVLQENIAVERRLHPRLPHVLTDSSFLESAILNLCINARDAMPDGGTLRIETDSVNLDAPELTAAGQSLLPGEYVTISVGDTGIGIEEEFLSRVAEPFFSTKAPEKGSGLGLATVDGFTRQCGGGMRLESRRHVGTTVTLFLPAHAGSLAPLAETGGRTLPVSEGRAVLVVDDNATIRSLLSRSLAQSGYRVSTAVSGDAALREFAGGADDFDVLLTDIVMPGNVQGPELAERLKARNPALRTIILSGSPVEADLGTYDLKATDRVLMKPVAHTDLLAVIDELLRPPD